MSLTLKRILIPILLLMGLMFLIWSTLKIMDRISENDIPETNTPTFDFSKNPTEELAKKEDITSIGAVAKQELLSDLNGEAGVLFRNERFKIEYFPPLENLEERFIVEINSVDFEGTKEEVRAWFMGRGFSREDTCNLLITFYPTTDVLKNSEEERPVFNPIFDNCDADF